MTEEQIKNLLRQRAEPKAPEGYYDGLLRNLHQRQREELLRRPLWRIAFDRISTFFGEHSLSTPKYAFALASVTAVGVLSILALRPNSSTPIEAGGAIAGTATPKVDLLPATAVQDEQAKDHQKRGVPAQQVNFEKP